MELQDHHLRVKDIGIGTYRENIVFMRSDCAICRSEGFKALTRLIVSHNGKSIVATLNVVKSGILKINEVGLSIEALRRLGVSEGERISIRHLEPVDSLRLVRAKMYRNELKESEYMEIVSDIVAGKYSNIEIAAFITACAGDNLKLPEIIGLTKAMVSTGLKLDWGKDRLILDKHCVGGLPGNRTTPIVVSILASAGLTIPKTSSKAITSPAGTADMMQTITNVDLDLQALRKVVEKENGCLAWGGAVDLSPADDILISVERALDVDSIGQMIASVLSKKAAAGSSHVLIDMPVGPTAKVRNAKDAEYLASLFQAVAQSIGLKVKVLISDGTQPIGVGIGPALEAFDVLSVLRREKGAPQDLRERSLEIASSLMQLTGKWNEESSRTEAVRILDSGQAEEKFVAICNAQGAFKEPKFAKFRHDQISEVSGVVKTLDNRKLSRIAKLAGAPESPSAGLSFFAPVGKKIEKGEVLFSVFAESSGELEYAKEYLNSVDGLIDWER
ncbi:thymidine phosphorylase [Leptospira perolatii]|uniref:thymidine phosphorylase n=1 Tax=Leptospira perolatii TaxID=2023191 RepID=A0A2M9ZLJ1_9LEPT|nr:thymidine phosphorylase family protein [Leptospira perolatii]PJZ69825.1 thymidine phosphorylase [Leptospira perolatii]PJZ72960.1 thymidine phosphorylase [Leptospira perolatii]